ncbi:MAG: hypothetical protein JKX97_04645 [Candidatus Lindowbacteria bacterium]|nr:hypothetical protein [Candidatus Lindowbacteria bacterium]
MIEEEKTSKNGSLLAMVGSLIIAFTAIALLVAFTSSQPNGRWGIVTERSDDPSQVIEGIQGLDREIQTRYESLEAIRTRAERKADEHRRGQVESGEVLNDAMRVKLAERAPKWDEVAVAADESLRKYGKN